MYRPVCIYIPTGTYWLAVCTPLLAYERKSLAFSLLLLGFLPSPTRFPFWIPFPVTDHRQYYTLLGLFQPGSGAGNHPLLVSPCGFPVPWGIPVRTPCLTYSLRFRMTGSRPCGMRLETTS